MSKLKAFDIVVAEEGYCEGIVKYRRSVYDKSEADKVIAGLKERYFELQDTAIKIDKELTETRKKLRHQKYKRCLAAADYCYTNLHCIMGHRLCSFADWKKEWFERWHRRWMELAEVFK